MILKAVDFGVEQMSCEEKKQWMELVEQRWCTNGGPLCQMPFLLALHHHDNWIFLMFAFRYTIHWNKEKMGTEE